MDSHLPRAIWICDRRFAALTWISIASLLEQVNLKITVFYTGDPGDQDIQEAFEELIPDLEWIWFDPPQLPGRVEEAFIIRNRMARFAALRRYPEGRKLLLDSDTVYGDGIKEAILAWKRHGRFLTCQPAHKVWRILVNTCWEIVRPDGQRCHVRAQRKHAAAFPSSA